MADTRRCRAQVGGAAADPSTHPGTASGRLMVYMGPTGQPRRIRPMAKDDWKREHDERLAKLGLGGNRAQPESPRCIHCGNPFDPHSSTGGAVGICQRCIDG
jgi:hypothetical protein